MSDHFHQGQVNVTSSAQQLTSDQSPVETLLLRAFNDNTATVYFGESDVSTSTGYPLFAGEEFVITPANANLKKMPLPSEIYVVGTSPDKVAFIGTRR